MSIKVGGPDPGVLSRRMRHHAEQFRPLIDALIESLLFDSKLARDDEEHLLWQSRTGPGSFGLYLANGEEYHFRQADMIGGPGIAVLDGYQNGKLIRTITSAAEARNFMRLLGRRKVKAAA